MVRPLARLAGGQGGGNRLGVEAPARPRPTTDPHAAEFRAVLADPSRAETEPLRDLLGGQQHRRGGTVVEQLDDARGDRLNVRGVEPPGVHPAGPPPLRSRPAAASSRPSALPGVTSAARRSAIERYAPTSWLARIPRSRPASALHVSEQ